ncbi:hypothetical protein WA577_002541, partial [Blastocystis sp. JDR]
IHLILVAPPVLSSKESQTNDIVLDKVIKTASDSLRIHLFGASVDIQKYIPSLYTTLWDYCLLYRKPSLDCIVIPQEGESSGSLLEASLSSVFVPDVFPNDFVLKVNEERRGKGLPVLECTPIPTPRWSDSIAPLDWESSRVLHFKTVCVGGTFDRLHPGHRILLTLASLVCDHLVIGLTTDEMLQKKDKRELIRSYADRKSELTAFLSTIAPSLQIDVNPLHDVCGPAIERADIEGIVVSLETLTGGELINQKRAEK